MTKRSIRFILLLSLVAAACSDTDDQTSKTTPSNEITNAPTSQSTTSTIIEISDTASSDQTANIEKITVDLPESTSFFEDFSSNFSDRKPEINRTHPFQTLDTFCTTYPPVKEEIVPATVEVKRGDSLAKIASKHDLTLEEILEMNEIANPNLIFIGQEIRVGEDLQIGLGPQSTGRGITENSVSIVNIETSTDELQTLSFEDFSGDTS